MDALYVSATRNDYIIYPNRVVLGNTVIPRSAISKIVWVEPYHSFTGMIKIYYDGFITEITVSMESKPDFLAFKETLEEILM